MKRTLVFRVAFLTGLTFLFSAGVSGASTRSETRGYVAGVTHTCSISEVSGVGGACFDVRPGDMTLTIRINDLVTQHSSARLTLVRVFGDVDLVSLRDFCDAVTASIAGWDRVEVDLDVNGSPGSGCAEDSPNTAGTVIADFA